MLTAKQKEFCKQISLGKNATDAYQLAFKNNSRKTSRINGSKLLKNEAVKNRIDDLQKVARHITEKSQKEIIDKAVLKEVMDVNERMSVLTQIARGEIPLMKPMVCDGIIQEVQVVPDWMDRKNAIAELNKMDGAYSPDKHEHQINGIKSLIIEPVSANKG